MTKKGTLNTARLHETRLDQLVAELHDGVCQQLVTMLWELESLKTITDHEQRLTKVNNLAGDLRDVVAEVQQIIYDRRPQIIDQCGLVGGLEEWVQKQLSKYGIEFVFECSDSSFVLSRYVQGQIFRMIQEGVNNCISHAKAKQVSLAIHIVEGLLTFELADDGRGFSPDLTTGLGLELLHERATTIQAELVVHSNPGEGTCLQIILPYEGDKE